MAAASAVAQDKSERRELIGKVGTRSALLILHATERPDGGWSVAGEYVILATLARRFLEGERSPELGVTTLKEGTTPILFGRPGTGELRGTWRDGVFKGARLGTGGQLREEFEFNQDFPAMEDYDVAVRCEAKEGRYQARLNYKVAKESWTVSNGAPSSPAGKPARWRACCRKPMPGGLRFSAGGCRVTLRNLGDFVALSAEGCSRAMRRRGLPRAASRGSARPLQLLRHGAR